VIAERFEHADVLDALVGDLGLTRDAEEVHHDARGIEAVVASILARGEKI
jgi:hypothetical protein